MKDALVAKELQKWPAGRLGVDHHVRRQFHPPVLCISSRVPDSGELLLRGRIPAALGVVGDPLLHTVIQNQTKEAVKLPGLLKREPGQIFVPERRQNVFSEW